MDDNYRERQLTENLSTTINSYKQHAAQSKYSYMYYETQSYTLLMHDRKRCEALEAYTEGGAITA